MWPYRCQPTRLPRPWDSPGKNNGVGCHFLLQRRKVKSESEVAQSCPTLSDPKDCSLPGSSVHGIFQARALEWAAIAFSEITGYDTFKEERTAEWFPWMYGKDGRADKGGHLARRDGPESFTMKPVRCPNYRVMMKSANFLGKSPLSQVIKDVCYLNNWWKFFN